MKIFLGDKEKTKNLPARLRAAGYHRELNRKTGEFSYHHSPSGNRFPRFHLYIEEEADGWTINLHLDQKAPSYEGSAAHSGEYDGEIVEAEAERIRKVFYN